MAEISGTISRKPVTVEGAIDGTQAAVQGDIAGGRKAIEGSIEEEVRRIDADISRKRQELTAELPGTIVVSVPGKVYGGPYEVTPKLSQQALETEGTFMKEDVIVKEIPIYVVSNNSGGTTVIIGG